jgi:hypothetical protein
MPNRNGDQLELTPTEQHEEWVKVIRARLVTLAKERLQSAGPHGVTFDEVRFMAETRGWLTGEEAGRTLSFGASVMREAGGVATGYQASKHRKSKNRPIRIWVHAQFLDTPKRRVG